MIKKKIMKLILIVIIIISVITIQNVYAANIGWAQVTRNYSNSSANNDGEEGDPKTTGKQYGNSWYNCSYKYDFQPNTSITVNGYNMNGDSLMDETTIMNYKFKSGTWIGLNIKEIRTAYWNVLSAGESYESTSDDTYEYYETKKSYTCYYQISVPTTIPYTYDCLKRGSPSYDTQLTTGWNASIYYPNYSCNSACNYHWKQFYNNSDVYGVGTLTSCSCYDPYYYNCTNCCTSSYTGTTTKKIGVSKTVKYAEDASCNSNAWVSYDGKSYYGTYSSKSTVTYVSEKISLKNIANEIERAKVVNDCRDESIEVTRREALNYVNANVVKVRYVESNDYPNSSEDLDASLVTLPDPDGVDTSNPRYKKGNTYATEQRTYNYSPTQICINVKTSDVNYRKCKTDEMDVTYGTSKNGNTFWRYFIPLNTKSNSKYYLKMEQKNGNLSAKECLSVLENHSKYVKIGDESKREYVNYIRRLSGEDFIGDAKYYSNGTINTKSSSKKKNSDVYYIINEGGCAFSTSINLNVIQKFYNEEKDNDGNLKFNGFNFYYRPINILEPFPNGVSKNSYWTGKETFEDSFEELTYVTHINLNEIKKYNYKYSDWENTMNKNGSNNFISNYQSIERKTAGKIYYELGCGPNWRCGT